MNTVFLQRFRVPNESVNCVPTTHGYSFGHTHSLTHEYDPKFQSKNCPKDVKKQKFQANIGKSLMLNFRLLEGLPNTYFFAKNLAEQAVESYRKAIPLCIVRPPIGKRSTCELHETVFKFVRSFMFIVLSAHNEPAPGWIHGWSAAAALTAFILTGFQRFILTAMEDTKIEIVPVDHVVNLIIAAAWKTATARKM